MRILGRCKNCGKETYITMVNCTHCGKPLIPEEEEEDWKQGLEEAQKTGDWSKLPNEIVDRCASKITLTTAFSIANREIEREIEVVSAECVFGMNIFRDFFAGVTDIFGGRSGATQNVLRDARRTVLTELRREALIVGADAVIGVDLDYSEFSGKMKSMLFLVASGTAVKLKPEA
ncbi:MAG: heavy metal-binding domain-containing protein [Nitrospinae bacterium]|nr:heavy metal-binding domain-containing protein [Nitrospinota bacterium]